MEPEQTVPPNDQSATAPQPQAQGNVTAGPSEDDVVLTSPATLMNISLSSLIPKPIIITLYKTHLKIEYTDSDGSNPDANKTVADIPITEIQEVKAPSWFQENEMKTQWQLEIKTASDHYKIAWRNANVMSLGAALGGFTPPNGLSVKDWDKLWVTTIQDLKTGVTPTGNS